MLNKKLFEDVQNSHKKILIVTKYWEKEKTLDIYKQAQKNFAEIIFGLGENRIETVIEKGLSRNIMHFIGNIQSQKISKIVKCCGVIHSLSSLKHATKIENIGLPISAFIQINLDKNKNIGISQDDLGYFLQACKHFKYLKIIGISGMGAGDISTGDKRDEFKKLISLRNSYIPNGLISAGTSRDYEIALEEGIDIVRVGNSVIG